ncbi:MAG: deoxyribodipyrimidine photolyase [Planctomycetes bacterium]|nr:deoxyribodipyrimidine photolyase [Planctomycetota bacterium]
MNPVPELRVRAVSKREPRPEREYVLYWCTAYRRTGYNFALQRAVEHARALDRPLLVLDALRADYRWASDRLHAFALGAIAETAAVCASRGVAHYAYVEPSPGAGKGLLSALASRAAVVVSDEFPCGFHPAMVESAARQLDVRLELVDSCGILPLRAATEVFPTAYAFRRFLQKNLPRHLAEPPAAAPLARLPAARAAVTIDERVESRWPRATAALLAGSRQELARLPIDHSVAPSVPVADGSHAGGEAAGSATLARFLSRRLVDYDSLRSDPDSEAASGLSPYLHYGMLSIHQVFAALTQREEWTPARLSSKTSGSRAGWWGMSTPAEAFLDEAVTWRELGFNFCSKRADHDRYESLPLWARQTLEEHAADPRPVLYSKQQLEQAATHDKLWNAAQRELTSTGRMHNYLRMLWGKKILEWTESPRAALEAMIELNNKYALDGRDPNSYSGIFWVLGRYDRPWGPERPIFGKIRYMSSDNTARKWSVDGYLARFGKHTAPPQTLFP